MYAALGDDLGDRLRDGLLHERLALAGVRRLQLNLDDADVVPAMRLAAGPEHIGAVVSVGAYADPRVTEALASATTKAHRLGGRRAAPDPAARGPDPAYGTTRWPTSPS